MLEALGSHGVHVDEYPSNILHIIIFRKVLRGSGEDFLDLFVCGIGNDQPAADALVTPAFLPILGQLLVDFVENVIDALNSGVLIKLIDNLCHAFMVVKIEPAPIAVPETYSHLNQLLGIEKDSRTGLYLFQLLVGGCDGFDLIFHYSPEKGGWGEANPRKLLVIKPEGHLLLTNTMESLVYGI